MSIISYFPTSNKFKKDFEAFGDIITVKSMSTTSNGTTLSYYSGNHLLSTNEYVFSSIQNKLTAVYLPECQTIGSRTFTTFFSLSYVSLPKCTTIMSSAFHLCSSLQSVNAPNCTQIDYYAFAACRSLSSAYFPKCMSIATCAFLSTPLVEANFPLCSIINNGAFYDTSLTYANFPLCQTLLGSTTSTRTTFKCPITTISFPNLTTISTGYVFYGCSQLMSIYLTNSVVCSLNTASAFNNTPIVNSTYTGAFGSIYVPASLLASYKAASNWKTISNRITSI